MRMLCGVNSCFGMFVSGALLDSSPHYLSCLVPMLQLLFDCVERFVRATGRQLLLVE